MARIKEHKRNTGHRPRNPVIYIICEGSKTEINYFCGFRTRYSIIDIKPITSKHKSALHLVKHAEDIIKQEPYYPEDGDEIWCVFDRDGNTNEELQKAESFAKDHEYSIVFSNQAFELWYLLHFTDQKSYLADADAVIAKLKSSGWIPNYNKSTNYYDELLPMRQQAIKRALTLLEYHEGKNITLLHRDINPCTTVVKLVEHLLERTTKR